MIDDREERVNDIWGNGQFDWTIGKGPEGWFWYCGDGRHGGWLHHGTEPSIGDALLAMIAVGGLS